MAVTAVRKAATPRTNMAPSEFAQDPFIKRLADPSSAERDARSRADITAGLKHLRKQRERAELADDMYDGDVGMTYASDKVRRLLVKQGINENEIPDFNYAKIPVDAIANRLKIATIKVAPKVTEEDAEGADDEGDPGAPDDDQEGGGTAGQAKATVSDKLLKQAERAVKRLDRANRMDVYRKDLIHKTSKHGDAFLFLWPVVNAKGKIVSVDMRVNSAHNVAFLYDEEDPLLVDYVIKSWETEIGEGTGRKKLVRANLYYPGPRTVGLDGEITQGAGRVERWTTGPGEPPDNPESWKRVHQVEDLEPDDVDEIASDEFGDAEDPLDKDDIPSPFGLTWFHFRNDLPHGRPEHVSAYGPQKMINKLIWSYAGIIDYQGFPQRYIMVDPKIDDPLLNVVNPDHPEDDEDDPENEHGNAGLRSDPAEVWRLFGKSTGQYSAADPDTFMKPLDRFITAMSELTDLPRYSFTKASADLPSGEAIRGLNGELLAKVEDRQIRYDPELEDSYELALRMLGIEGIAVDVRWAPAAPVNDLNGLQVAQAKVALGVPNEVVLNEVGYPDEQIDEWLRDREGASLTERLDDLVKLGTAVQALGAGVTLGVVDEAAAKAFVSRMIRLTAEGTTDPAPGPDALPTATFRDPPPANPAMAAVEAGKLDPLRQAQVKATHATADTSRASAEMMRSGQPGQPQKRTGPAGAGQARSTTKRTPAKKAAQKAAPAKAAPSKAVRRSSGGL